jgi:CubicO group peptidase (beta-lactamase class C family)
MIPRSSRAFDAGVLAAVSGWRARTVAVAVVDAEGLVAARGPLDAILPWASVTKPVTACTVLAGVDRGLIGLDDAAGPPGCTVRHLLAHASGLSFDDERVLAPPARMRIYSNTGFDVVAEAVSAAAGRPFGSLVHDWVLDPLGMTTARLVGRPSEGMAGSVMDLARFAHELLAPRLLPEGLVEAAATPAFPGLRGVLPGFGLQAPNDWGLGFEIRGTKAPHWTGTRSSPGTFGHFGGSGTFLWVDRAAGIALACLTDRPFGAWAGEAWPTISDAVLAAAAAD